MSRKRWVIIGAVLGVAGVLVAVVALKTRTRRGREDLSRDTGLKRVRQPAVAGLFYPGEKEVLEDMVDGFLGSAKAVSLENIRGLICPHAGYRFSGQTAAEAYKQLQGRNVRTVVVMAPSHCAAFHGASIPDVDAYETPLGEIALSAKARQLGKVPPFVCNPPCQVRRPQWWRRAPKPLPAFGEDTPHTWEHSLEVQLPFLQRTLKDFEIIPIIFGEVDAQEAAEVLMKHVLDDETVFVASSDLSHYYPYDAAKHLDTLCIRGILDLDIEGMKRQEACGMKCILTLMHMARRMGWERRLLKYCNSGDTAGDKSGVVGYAAIVFFGPERARGAPQTQPTEATTSPEYSHQERKILLELARRTVKEVVETGKTPEVDAADFPAKFMERKGCFVTLTVEGNLRGCIGHIFPREPLYKAVMDNARSAAILDKRFDPVRVEDLEKIEIEISVLTVPRVLNSRSPLDLLSKLRPGIDGVVLKVGSRQGTYLPQVWRRLPNKAAFLSQLSAKAGLPPSGWQHSSAVIWTYQAEAFKESEM